MITKFKIQLVLILDQPSIDIKSILEILNRNNTFLTFTTEEPL